MNRYKLEQKFLKLLHDDPQRVLSTLTDWQLSKPLILQESMQNGGKLGTRGLDQKYGFYRQNISRFLKKERQKNDTNNNK